MPSSLEFRIDSPEEGHRFGLAQGIRARGTAHVTNVGLPTFVITGVDVQFGAGGEFFNAELSGSSWELFGVPVSINTVLDVVARCHIRFLADGSISSATDGVSVVVGNLIPRVDIDPFDTDVMVTDPPYNLPEVNGSVTEPFTDVTNVQWRLDGGPLQPVDSAGGGRWRATNLSIPAGQHDLTFVATDPFNSSGSATVSIFVRTPLPSTAIEQAFAPTTYLRELLDFATRQIKIGAATTGPTAQVLANRFFQPFDELIVAKNYEQAVLPVHQARIAIEVLHRQIQPAVPPMIHQRFRFAAYQALIRELGTSHEELHRARVADATTRRALAARIGIELVDPRPDRLDQITFMPNDITDAKLETLFGYRSPTAANPLEPPGDSSTFLLWRFDALRNAWQRDDVLTRDNAAGSLPIIDPDVIDKGNIKTQEATNPAFALWTARKSWIDTTLTNIEHEAESQANPLARFDQIVLAFVGNIDLPTLATRDANGEDVTRDIRPFNLSLEAFRFLARCRELLIAGTLLQAEWQDIFAILLQAQKQVQYSQWRAEEREKGLILEPSQFLPDTDGQGLEIPRWRGSLQTFSQWRRTLRVRVAQHQSVENSYRTAVDAAEAQTLPGLRDALLEVIGQRQPEPENLQATAERLTRELLIDFRANAGSKMTRVDQALETLQGILFCVRSGRLTTGTDGEWTLNKEQNFDAEWVWMGSYGTWLAAIRIFAYPENQLFPNLYVPDDPFLKPTTAFFNGELGNLGLIQDLRQELRMTPELARQKAKNYLDKLRTEVTPLPPELRSQGFLLTDQMSDADLIKHQELVTRLFDTLTDPNDVPQYLREVFWLVPMALALRLQEEREYLAALDWFQTVYAFNLPPANRKIYRGLKLEESIKSAYVRLQTWLTEELNPHIIARPSTAGTELVGRKNVYTRFTVMSIVRCFLDYADHEFSRNLAESIARARTLYETAIDLLGLEDVRPETGPTIPYPTNPVWESLRLHAHSNLEKIHNGMNIAGVRAAAVPVASSSVTVFLPSQYRYAVLIERAKNLVSIAQQVESAFLSALERRDAEAYSLLQANRDMQVATGSKTLSDLKVTDADITVVTAQLQQEKAQVQFDHYEQLIHDGLNHWEIASVAAMGTAVYLQSAAGVVYGTNAVGDTLKAIFTWGILGDPGEKIGQTLSAFATAASLAGGLTQTLASFERRKEEWRLQKHLSDKEVQIGAQQILHAENQKQVALQEQETARLQLEHATTVMNFLANKFTNVELFEWMSGVLGRVYAYFLQQATAIAQLAQAQLAFERQEPAPGFVRSDYWQDTSKTAIDTGSGDPVDRRGLTGSARLLQDIYRLDQYAFETDRRKLHLTQTLSLTQIAALEMQRFRETGVLVFATPMDLFDQEFPGHYLRLIKRVRMSVLALVPSLRGVRATLSASGFSRVIAAGEKFSSVTLSRSPEAIAFTSPLNATGLFELEPENGLLLPFEGMGLETVWQLELPKAANPFDYRTIVDVLLTIEYTALHSHEYRQQVLRDRDQDFNGDRAFSVRQQFPDVWYELNNPETVVNGASRMRATLTTRREDFPPHVENLTVKELSLFCVRKEGFTQELLIKSLRYTVPGQEPITTAEVQTTEGIFGTRRPSGAPWQVLVGKDPVGEWSLQLDNTARVREWFKKGLIEDVVLVMTVSGVTPAWP